MIMAVAIALKCKEDFKNGGSPDLSFVPLPIHKIY